ncbi:phytoene desaturase family protein [Ulvibacterium marinum]|uniref:NAD(P)/FAD-dependent oxidoreductase n=1 Tax=Ulvibacterium marinum TaxID=2419782 RepID=A0A3B0C5W6_9FLAO|nr:NAD(P)/FAD-dependent oxidoreductase [Ulvibacterium marinum]RKN81835.1 NAD(P)/FAD-dependent oxidoreductase [Ulvibacterium marinum]
MGETAENDKSVSVKNLNSPEDNKWDTIVIGSGAGGLATGICLARAGQKVLVLEQHDVPGGWCHSFYLDGHRFTPGVHYVGLLAEGEATNDLYRGLGIANDLVFFRMNPDAYEHAWIGEERFDFPSNLEQLIDRLTERFPEERKSIHTYLNLVRNVSVQIYSLPYFKGFWQKLTIPYKTRHMGKYGLFSLRKVINWHIKNPLLKNILNIQCGDHGLQPKKAAFPLHCALMSHYFNGAYYPMGGGGALIKAMTNALKKHGGHLQTGTTVNRILTQGERKKRAIGVALENGQLLYANTIVSNADPGITYLNLVGKENLSSKLQKKLSKTKYSCTSLMLFLTVDMDLRKAGLDSGNIWLMPNKDTDDLYDDLMTPNLSNGEAFEAMFISCTSLKDPASYDGKHHTIEAITLIDYSTFEKYKEETEPRSEGYIKFKEILSQKMLNGLSRAIPGVRDHIVQMELGTPITNEYYINTTRGNVYGTEKSLRHIGPFAFKAKSEIENLYLCGASILSHGVAGASHSGVDTAATILGCEADELKKPQDDQYLRIYEAENPVDYPDWMLKKIEVKRARAISKMAQESV